MAGKSARKTHPLTKAFIVAATLACAGAMVSTAAQAKDHGGHHNGAPHIDHDAHQNNFLHGGKPQDAPIPITHAKLTPTAGQLLLEQATANREAAPFIFYVRHAEAVPAGNAAPLEHVEVHKLPPLVRYVSAKRVIPKPERKPAPPAEPSSASAPAPSSANSNAYIVSGGPAPDFTARFSDRPLDPHLSTQPPQSVPVLPPLQPTQVAPSVHAAPVTTINGLPLPYSSGPSLAFVKQLMKRPDLDKKLLVGFEGSLAFIVLIASAAIGCAAFGAWSRRRENRQAAEQHLKVHPEATIIQPTASAKPPAKRARRSIPVAAAWTAAASFGRKIFKAKNRRATNHPGTEPFLNPAAAPAPAMHPIFKSMMDDNSFYYRSKFPSDNTTPYIFYLDTEDLVKKNSPSEPVVAAPATKPTLTLVDEPKNGKQRFEILNDIMFANADGQETLFDRNEFFIDTLDADVMAIAGRENGKTQHHVIFAERSVTFLDVEDPRMIAAGLLFAQNAIGNSYTLTGTDEEVEVIHQIAQQMVNDGMLHPIVINGVEIKPETAAEPVVQQEAESELDRDAIKKFVTQQLERLHA